MYRLHLKNVPNFCTNQFSSEEITDIKLLCSLIPEKYIDCLYTGASASSKRCDLPHVKFSPETASVYEVDSICYNGLYYDRKYLVIGDGYDPEQAATFMIFGQKETRGCQKIVSVRKLQSGETGEWFSHKRNLTTGEHGPAIPLWIEGKSDYLKQNFDNAIRTFLSTPGSVLFHYESYNPSYAKNLGNGIFEIVTDSHPNLCREPVPFSKTIGTFEDAIQHIANFNFRDLLDFQSA